MPIPHKFNVGLAAELPPKKYIIIVKFVINKSGEIVNIESSGSGYAKLDNEAKRAINLLPLFTPGMHNNKTVNTRYSFPISFKIQ
jgi:protein TonB